MSDVFKSADWAREAAERKQRAAEAETLNEMNSTVIRPVQLEASEWLVDLIGDMLGTPEHVRKPRASD